MGKNNCCSVCFRDLNRESPAINTASDDESEKNPEPAKSGRLRFNYNTTSESSGYVNL